MAGLSRPHDTPVWKLETALKSRSWQTPRYSPPVHMIKLTQEREVKPYLWVQARKHTTTWAAFIRTHQAVLAGTDFFTVEVLTLRGLVTHYVR